MKKQLLSIGLIALAPMVFFGQTNQLFTTAGPHNFTVPTGVLSVKVECVGGGGAGGRVTPSNIFDNDAAGGGGGGAYAAALVPVISGNIYPVFVGVGGINNGSSTNGGNSYFNDGSLVLAAGGTTRSGNDNTAGVAGGQASASVGTIKYSGGNGGNGKESDSDGGGGGGAAGSTGNGSNGGTVSAGGATPNFGGYGGPGGASGANGQPGGTYGGGGGGSSAQGSNDRNGGAGASGLVSVSWILVNSVTPLSLCAGSNEDIVLSGENLTQIDSVVIGGNQVAFNSIDNQTITVNESVLSQGGSIIVYSQNGAFMYTQTLQYVSNSVNPIVSGMTIAANYSGGATATYQWYDCLNGNAPIAGATQDQYTSSVNGLYSVTVIENGCAVSSSCVALVSASVENAAQDLISVYPNPTQDVLHISSASAQIENIEIWTMSGQLMHRYDAVQTLSLQALPKGIYLIKIQSNKGMSLHKIALH